MNEKDREEVKKMIEEKIEFHEKFSTSHQFKTAFFLFAFIFVFNIGVFWFLINSPLIRQDVLKNITSARWECQEYGSCSFSVCTILEQNCVKEVEIGASIERNVIVTNMEDYPCKVKVCPKAEEICKCLKYVLVREVNQD